MCDLEVTALPAKGEPLTATELADYIYWHDVAGHPHDEMLLAQAKGGHDSGNTETLKGARREDSSQVHGVRTG